MPCSGAFNLARAMNEGARSSQAEYLFFLNDDTSVEPNCIHYLERFLETRTEIAAVQPKILALDSPDCFDYAGACGGFMDVYGYPFLRGRVVHTVELDDGFYDQQSPVFWATGAALFLRREAFSRSGGFDEDFEMHMEEIDLAWRLWLSDNEVWVEPRAVVLHLAGFAPGRMSLEHSYRKHRNSLAMMIKNYSAASLARYLPIRILLELGSVIVSLGKGEISYAGNILRALGWVAKKLPLLIRKRRSVVRIRTRKESEIKELLYPRSILLDYYLRKKRRFRDLHWDRSRP